MESVPSAKRPGQGVSRVLVAVCTYNESANLPELVDRIFAALPQTDIVVVDDNSPDGTGRWAIERAVHDSRLKVIIRENARGLGGATKRAFQFAVDQRYDFLLNLDGDLSHQPEALPTMLAVAQNDSAVDVVVGSRYCAGGAVQGWPLRRRVMSRLVNRFAVSVMRLPVSDCSGSLRCYRVETLAKIEPSSLTSNGYAILEEVLLRLRAAGAKMVEVPIVFYDRTRGDSKLTLSEAFRSARQLVKMALTR
ncbi:MAG TPA: polyprenol monophosphomannose synthase [Planctomycetaceae bacterium]|nr:polyprenol monophosphomannose synthase [Planctomycetaceae bacterium]